MSLIAKMELEGTTVHHGDDCAVRNADDAGDRW